MNPDLKALWAKVVTLSRRAKAAGDQVTAEDVDQYLQARSGGKYGIKDINEVSLKNLGQSFVQGALLNFGDEIVGAMGGDQAKEDMRLRQRLFSEAHPVASGAAALAGGVAPFLIPGVAGAKVLGGAVKGTATATELMGRGAATGAAFGSAAGAGAGEDAASRTTGAAVGAGIGGVLGAAIPAAMGIYGYLKDPSRPINRILRAHFERTGGPAALQGEAARFAAAGKGSDVMLADLSPELRALTDRAATTSPRAAEVIMNAAGPRQAGMSERLLGDVQNGIPGVSTDATAVAAAQKRATSDWARNAYGDLREAYPEVPNTVFPKKMTPKAREIKAEIDQLKTMAADAPPPTPEQAARGGKTALERRIEMLQGEYNKLVPPMTRAEADFAKTLQQPFARQALKDAQELGLIGEVPEPTSNASFEKLFYIKKKVESAAQAAWGRAGGGDLGRRLTELQHMLDGHLVENVPEYSAITHEYARRMGLARALEKGRDAWGNTDTIGLKKLVKALTPDELQQYRIGMASELAAKLRNTGTNLDAANQLLNRGIAKNEMLEIIFGNPKNFTRFLEQAKLEHQMSRLRSTYTGSQTAGRTVQAAADPTDLALGVAGHTMSGGAWNLTKAMLMRTSATAARNALREKNAEALAPILMTRGQPAIDALLQKFMNPAPLMGNAAATAAPAAAGGALSTRNPFFPQP